ncbi:MFS transporter [Agrobacterium rhizogenes]|nr:MFS transporter [Rhizobium rhizogenes]NTH73311.1 MFS transporter [Rhizobium rhizogenes]
MVDNLTGLRQSYKKILIGFGLFRIFRNLTFHYAIMVAFYSSLELSVSQIGWLESAYWGSKLCSDIPAGYLADRYGHRRALYWGNLLIIASLALLIGSNTFQECIGAQIIVAMGHSLTAVADSAGCRQSLLNLRLATTYRSAEAIGIASRNVALFVGVTSGAILLSFIGLRGLFALSIVSLCAAIASVHLFCPATHFPNRKVVANGAGEGINQTPFGKNLGTVSLAITYACLFFIEFFSIPFTQVLLGEKGFSSNSIALLFGLILLGSGISSAVMSRSSASFGESMAWILSAVVVHGILLVVLVSTHWSYFLFGITYIGFMIGKGAYIPIIRSEILRTTNPSRASAVLGVVSVLGGAILFLLSPVIFDLMEKNGSIVGAIGILVFSLTGSAVMIVRWRLTASHRRENIVAQSMN